MDSIKKVLICPDCGGSVSPRANCCPHCGCPIEFVISRNNEIISATDNSSGFLASNKKINADDEDYYGGFNPFAFMLSIKPEVFLIYGNGERRAREREFFVYNFNSKSFERFSPEEIYVLSACNNDRVLYYVGLDKETHTRLSVFEVSNEETLIQKCIYKMDVFNVNHVLICEQYNSIFLFVSVNSENGQIVQTLYKLENNTTMVLCSKIGETAELVVGVAKGQDNCIYIAAAVLQEERNYINDYSLHYYKWNPIENSQVRLRKVIREDVIINQFELNSCNKGYSFSKNFRVENCVGEIEYYDYGESDIPNSGFTIYNRLDDEVVFQHECFENMETCNLETCVIDGIIFLRKESHRNGCKGSIEKVDFDQISAHDDILCNNKTFEIANFISCFELQKDYKRTRIVVGNKAFQEYEKDLKKIKQEMIEEDRQKRWLKEERAQNPEWLSLMQEMRQYELDIPSYKTKGKIYRYDDERIYIQCDQFRCFFISAIGKTIFVDDDNEGNKLERLKEIVVRLTKINQFLPVPNDYV